MRRSALVWQTNRVFLLGVVQADNLDTVNRVTDRINKLTSEPTVKSLASTLCRSRSWSLGDQLKSRKKLRIREYKLATVESNVVPNLNVLGKQKNTKTQKETDTARAVQMDVVNSLGKGPSLPQPLQSKSAESVLTYTCLGASEKIEKGDINRKLLVMNCEEISINTARKIVTVYSRMKANDYTMKRINQPNGEKRFDIKLADGVKPLDRQKWIKVGRALKARIKEDKQGRKITKVKGVRNAGVNSEGEISTMTYNINGFWCKRQELLLLLDQSRPTIVALQETLKATLSRSRIPGYQTIEVNSKPGGGTRGVLLAVKRSSGFSLCEYELEDWFVAGIVEGTLQDGTSIKMLTYSVYLPCTVAAGRGEAKLRLKRSIEKAWAKGNFSQILVMGDMNMDPGEVERFFGSLHVGFHRADTKGATRIGRLGSESTLDHIVYQGMGQPLKVTVRKEIDLSDHRPVIARWKLPSAPKVTKKLSLDTMEIILKRGFFLRDERWVTTAGSKSVDELEKNFSDVAWEIAKDNGVMREYKEPKWSNWMSKGTLKLIQARHEMSELRGTTLFNQEVYDALWADTVSARKDDAKRVSQKKIKDMCEAGRENRFKDLWKQLNSACNGNTRIDDESPVLDKKTGELKSTAVEKGKVWAEHFGGLAIDETGNSKSESYWKTIMPEVESVPTRDMCNDPLTWNELTMALRATPNGKASGIDKIPGELLKLVQNEVTPTSNLGKALWLLAESIWTQAKVPLGYRSAIVVPVPKKGDLSDPDNYRGISLISVVLKIVSKVVATRLQTIAERDNLLVKEQAGFRTMEECVAQVATLLEVVKRRANVGKTTYAVFIDFAKAYDKVPHAGLLRKLESIGIKGHLHKLITALYEDPLMCVRVGNDLSDEVRYSCGVRQGCPASPILFDIYINDLFEGIEGVNVPGLRDKIPGLLFADDAVVFADSIGELTASTERLTSWALKWEMKINAKKCGLIKFSDIVCEVEGREDRPVIMAGGDAIPWVDKYMYLGISLDGRLDRATMLNNNVAKGQKALSSLVQLFTKKACPTHLKLLVLKAKLIPILTYGGEIWGMNTQIASKAQKVCDDACRMIIRGGRSTGLKRVRDELHINTIASITATKRFRALEKFGNLSTWIATLMHNTVPAKLGTWITGGRRWMKTYARVNGGEQLRDSKRRLLNVYIDRDKKKDKTYATTWAKSLGLLKSTPWLKVEAEYPELCEMLTEIGRMRIGIFPTGRRLVYQRILGFSYSSRCPICGSSTPENLEHLFFECLSWNDVRKQMLEPCFQKWNDMVKSPAAMTLAVGVLLGGELGNSENANADTVIPCVISAMLATTKGQRELLVITAQFLASVLPIRRKILSGKLDRNLRRSSWNQGQQGTVALAES